MVVLRQSLASTNPRLVRWAVHGLGHWRDQASLPAILEMLGSAESGELRVLQTSLEEIAGISPRWSVESWRAWMRAQESWSRDSMDGTLDELGAEDPARVIAALRELSERRLYHREIAPRIALLLGNASSATAAAACAALGRLAADGALPALIGALDDEREVVRLAVYRALRSISGLELPSEVEAWQEWFGS